MSFKTAPTIWHIKNQNAPISNSFHKRDINRIISKYLHPRIKEFSEKTDRIGRILKRNYINFIYKPVFKITDIYPSTKGTLNPLECISSPVLVGYHTLVQQDGPLERTLKTWYVRPGLSSISPIAELQLDTSHKV